jgi:hypothetical protein
MARRAWLAILIVLAHRAAAAPQPALWPAVGLYAFDGAPVGDGWPHWGRLLGSASPALTLSVVEVKRHHFGRLRYREARGQAMLVMPDNQPVGRPMWLALKVKGDGGGNLLSVTLVDAGGAWLTTPGVRVTWRDWRDVRLDLTTFAFRSRGDEDERAQAPLRLLSLNLDFIGNPDGELECSDLQLIQSAYAQFDYLGFALDAPAGSHVLRPEDRPPALVVVNRGAGTQELDLKGRLGDEPLAAHLVAPPGGEARLPLPVRAPGPQRLEAAVKGADGRLDLRLPFAVLPPAAAPGVVDPFRGLGEYSLDDLLNGQFARDLPDLRAAGAGWTLLRLDRAFDDEALNAGQWRRISDLLTAAAAQDLRVVAAVPAAAFNGLPDEPPVLARQAVEQLGSQLDCWRLLPGAGGAAGDYPAALDAARASLATGRALTLLGDVGAAPRDALEARCDGLFVPLTAPSAPPTGGPFPFAVRALNGQVGALEVHAAWLMGDPWPLAELTGLRDPVAATAVSVICARAVPRAEAAGWGHLRGDDTRLLPSTPGYRDTFLAWAVAARLLAGLDVQDCTRSATGLCEVRFTGPTPLRAVWSEGGPRPCDTPPGAVLYDVLGRRIHPPVTVDQAPVYILAGQRR